MSSISQAKKTLKSGNFACTHHASVDRPGSIGAWTLVQDSFSGNKVQESEV